MVHSQVLCVATLTQPHHWKTSEMAIFAPKISPPAGENTIKKKIASGRIKKKL